MRGPSTFNVYKIEKRNKERKRGSALLGPKSSWALRIILTFHPFTVPLSVTSTDTTATESTPLATLLGSLLGSDGEKEDKAGKAKDVHTQVRNEVLTYFGENSLAKEETPLLWWKVNNDIYPMLARLAKSYLCIPASSTPSERLFSAAGNIASKKRESLSQEPVDMLTFLHCNAKCLNKGSEREREREREELSRSLVSRPVIQSKSKCEEMHTILTI